MGRNNIPKLNAWRDGALYRIRRSDGGAFIDPGDGHQVIYTRTDIKGEVVLACAWADGAPEMLARFYQDGFSKGLQAGRAEARAEILAALGIRGGKHD